MSNDNEEQHHINTAGIGELPPPSPIQAKDLVWDELNDLSARILRSYLAAGADALIWDEYGTTPDMAQLALHCAELAILPAWDIDALVEVARQPVLCEDGELDALDGRVSAEKLRRHISLVLTH